MTIWTAQELAAKLSGSPFKLHYRTEFQGLPISIENRKGSKRVWGKEPHEFTRMKLPYGYIRGAEGYDGDEVDVFIGPNKKSEFVFIVNQRQRRSLGKFDEHKVMLGFDSMSAARKAYLDHYDKVGESLIGSIRMWTMTRFKKWLADARATDGPVRKSLSEALREPELLLKARTHKYKSRKRVGNRWVYEYDEPKAARAKRGVAEVEKLQPNAKGEIDPPFPTTGNPGEVFEPFDYDLEDYHEDVEITLASIMAGPQKVDKHRVLDMLQKEQFGTKKDKLPLLIKWPSGRIVINDGHHRLAAAMWAGKKTARVRLIVSEEDPVDAEDAEMFFKAGPFVGPRGGLWADAKHTVAWKADYRNTERNEARIEALGRQLGRAIDSGNESDRKYASKVLEEDHGVTVHHEAKGAPPPKPAKLQKRLFHAAPAHALESIQSEGLKPREGSGLFAHGSYGAHSQGKVFLADSASAAHAWHSKVEDMLFHHHDDPKKQSAAILRVKPRRTARDPVGDEDVPGSRMSKKAIPPEHLEFFHKDSQSWKPLAEWKEGAHGHPPREDSVMHKALFHILLEKAEKPPAGYTLIPGGKKGGYRKRRGKGWDYWYPSKAESKKKRPTFAWGESKWTEKEFHDGDFDTNPDHWQPFQINPGRPAIGGERGGVQFDSQHPVKEAGYHPLYRIHSIDRESGWVVLSDVNTGTERHVSLDRVIPVFHEIPKTKPQSQESEPWDPTQDGRDPEAISPASKTARRLPAFEQSLAKPGTALAAMEGGVFLRHSETVFELDATGNSVRVTREKTYVDNQTKEKLLAEFARMLSVTAQEVKDDFNLKSQYRTELGQRRIDETLVELRSSALEGMLVAMERYEGALPFAPLAKQYARDYARVQAASEHAGGMVLPRRIARMLSGFIAARIQMATALGIDNPSPRQIAKGWNLRKRHVHSNLRKDDPQYNEPVPLKPYVLKVKKIETTGEGKRKKITTAIGTEKHVGKLEWAKRIHSFLTGQTTAQGSDFFEGPSAIFPGVHMGVGLSPAEKVDVRASVRDALEALTTHEIIIQSGRQSSTYRADSKAIVMKMLGLEERDDKYSFEEVSATLVAGEVSIAKKTKDGWKQIGRRQKETLIHIFLERALDTLTSKLVEQDKDDAAALVRRAQKRLVPEEHARPGLTFRQVLQIRAREVTKDQVQAWRKKQRDRLRRMRDRARNRAKGLTGKVKEHQLSLARAPEDALRRIDRMGRREVAMKIALSQSSHTSEAIRAMQLKTIEVDVQSPGHEYGWMVVTMTDPTTGRQRRVRMRTIRKKRGVVAGEPLKKAEPMDEELLLDMLRWPRLTALLWGRESIPTTARFQLETLVGLH